MKDRERLIAEFLDGEAVPEEREALLAGLMNDPKLAREVASLLATERLLRLQRPDGGAFAREVLERLRSAGKPTLSRGVVRRIGLRIPWRVLVSAAALLVIAVVVALVVWPGKTPEGPWEAAIEESLGIVHVGRASARLRGKAGMAVEPGDEIVTERGSNARIRYRHGTTLSVGPDTSVWGAVRAVTEGTSERLGLFLRVDRGTLGADVNPQAKERPFVFQTPHAELKVLGTRLRIDVTPDKTRLEVESGRVRVTGFDRATAEVAGGQYAVIERGRAWAVRPLGPEPGPVALYRFRESVGGQVRDVSGREPALDFMMMDGAFRPLREPWKVGPGVTVSFVEPPTRLVDSIRKSRAITIEMWLQHEGAPRISHVVRTFDASGVVHMYREGVPKSSERLVLDLGTWDGDFRKLLADEVSRKWPWPGEYHLLAIYDRTLPADEVRRNFESGRPK